MVLLNRACCDTGWPQEGIYLMMGTDLSDPQTWSAPVKVLTEEGAGVEPAYYPQVFGTGEGETDTLVGETARLFVKGVSKWELKFVPPPAPPAPPAPPVTTGEGEEGESTPEAVRAKRKAVSAKAR